MICLPIFSVSFQMAALCHPSWYYGRIMCVAPEAVARFSLRADLCTLLCGFHIGDLNTSTAYVHVLFQLTSMDRNWKTNHYLDDNVCLYTCNSILWMQRNKDKNWQECHHTICEFLMSRMLQRYSYSCAYYQNIPSALHTIKMFLSRQHVPRVHVYLVTVTQIYTSNAFKKAHRKHKLNIRVKFIENLVCSTDVFNECLGLSSKSWKRWK